ncbi:MAG: ParA family protein [Chromatiales bacterium]|jgi:chromosome partitioning protein|nr:ParA family protein [Chromatiales bacterium]
MKTLALYSVKGGVGKTSSAVNLAHLAANSGLRTLLWDLDHQAATTFSLRIRSAGGGAKRVLSGAQRLDELIKASDYERLDVLPARFSFRNADAALDKRDDALKRFRKLIKPLAGAYDVLVFDCPPGLTLMAESVMNAADAVLVPVIPTPFSLHSLQLLAKHLGESTAGRRVTVWPFFSMVDMRRSLHKELCTHPENLAYPPLAARIPYASQVERMSVERAPVTAFAGRSGPARAYAALWEETASRLGILTAPAAAPRAPG